MSGKTGENDKVYRVFSASAADITVPKGGCIIREGEPPQYLYFIRQGEVQLSKPSAEDKVFTFEKKRPGQLLAASHLFNPIPSLFQADSIEDSRLLRLPITDVENLTAHDYEFAVALFKQLNAENGVLLSQCRDYIFCGSRQAVYAVLIRLANEYGVNIEQGILINKKVTNQEIADHIGLSRESINRILNRLNQAGILFVQSKYIVLYNLERLAEELGCYQCNHQTCKL